MIGAHNGPFRKNRDIAQAGLDFDFRANLYQKIDTDGTDMARTSTLSDLVDVTRASKKTDAGGWDFTNGSTVGALTEYDNNIGAVHPTAGLLVEESSTNEISNPRFEGATPGVVGSGGVVPTDYLSSPGSATLEVIGTGTENGWPYLELEYTAAGAAFPQLYGSAPTASAGQTWTSSWGVKVISSTGGFLGHNFKIREYNGGTITNDTLSSGYQEEPSVHSRGVFTATLTDGATTSARGGLLFGFNAAGSVRVRIYAPQLEQKEFPTSPILPPAGTPGATTRAADDVSIPNGAWANNGGDFTIYGEATTPPAEAPFPVIMNYSGPAQDRVAVQGLGAGNANVYWAAIIGGSSVLDFGQATKSTGEIIKFGIAAQTDNVAVSIDGMTQIVDTSCDTAQIGAGVLYLGQNRLGLNQSRLYLKDLRYFPERLTNAQLEALVGN